MKKEVIIDINAFAGNEEETIIVTTDGFFEGDGKNFTLSYSEGGELKGSETTLQVENGGESVKMTRRGEYTSQLFLENKKRHMCIYSTPYGQMQMAIYTNYIISDVTEKGGSLEMDYIIDFGNQITENHMMIKIWEA